MATLDSTSNGPANPVLPGFEPVRALWEGDAASFPSQDAARWAIKQHRPALIAAGALALHCGRVYVQRDLILTVMRQTALEAYKQRYAGSAS